MEVEKAVFEKDVALLSKTVPKNQHWRLFPLFQDSVLYLDIETAERYGDITVLGAWDGTEYFSFVKGCNLEKELVRSLLSHYKVFVTFNGSAFDIPIIERYFGGVFPKEMIHIDLRFVCAQLGLIGGLKTIERIMGIARDAEIDGMTGEEGALLWYEYLLTGDDEHVELLLEYNKADCVNLEPLAKKVIQELWEKVYIG